MLNYRQIRHYFLASSLLILAALVAKSAISKEINKSGETIQPLASKFWITVDLAAQNPPEELLWTEGVPDVKQVAEKTESRADDHLNRWITGIREPTITIYRPKETQSNGSAVVICPGGGYTGLAIDKEGHDTARWLNSLGITGVVLKYRCREYGQPAPGDDAQRAIALVRSRAKQLELDPNRIGVMGYSAGGHTASTAGTRFTEMEFNGKKVSSRPNFMILVYPVISMDETITHQGSRQNLLGRHPSEQLVKRYSNELQVTKQTPPTFLVHAADDRAVPVENSLRMMRALQDDKIPVELALYERGGHGFGLGAQPIPAARWPLRCERWLRQQGIVRHP